MLPVLAFIALLPTNVVDREAFTKRFERIQDSMSKDEVRKILGRPDVVWSEADPDPFDRGYGDETWGWGVEGRYSLPSRGYVIFGEDGKTSHYFKGPALLKPSRLSDAEWEKILHRIDRLRFPGGRFDQRPNGPRERIRLANYLIGLGEEVAIAAVIEYSKLETYDGDCFWDGLLHCLFERRSSAELPAELSEAQQKKAFLRWPTLWPDSSRLREGIPVQLDTPGYLDDFRFTVERRLEQLRKTGDFRTRPLVPTDDPLGLFKRIELRTRDPKVGRFQDDREVLGEEIASLLRTCVPPELEEPEQALEFLAEEKLRWDRGRQGYVREDGYFREHPVAPPRPKVIGPIEGLTGGKISAERVGRDKVWIVVRYQDQDGAVPMRLALSEGDRRREFALNLEKSEIVEQPGKIYPWRKSWGGTGTKRLAFELPSRRIAVVTVQISGFEETKLLVPEAPLGNQPWKFVDR